ncbi:MAG TPA: glycosyltransferase family 4 protein [Gaiellaceae bacterium]
MRSLVHPLVEERDRPRVDATAATRGDLHVVLVAHDVHDGGGMERACAELIRRAPSDISFTVVSRTLGDDLRERVSWRRVPTPNRPFLLKYTVFFLLASLRLLRTRGLRHSVGAIVPNRVDVAAVHFCHAGYVARTRRLAPPGATPLRALNTAVTRIVSKLAERWCYRPGRVRALAAVSAGVAQELEAHFPNIPIVVTPNGVDVVRFPSVEDGRHSSAQTAGKPLIALFVGGDWDRKGLGPAIEGLAEARRLSDRRLELWVVGRGDERRFRRLAEHNGVSRNVRFFGFRGGVEQFYDAADVLVLPTLYEADPLVVHEAAAAGLAIVVTRVNGVEELVGDDEAGFIVDRNAHAIGAALARLAVDEPLRLRQAAVARAKARAMSWERSTFGVVNLYRRLDEQSPAGNGRR